MLLILLVYLFIAFTSFPVGFTVLRLLKAGTSSIPLVSLCGLAVISMLCNWLSLVLPINWPVRIGVLLVSIGVWMAYWRCLWDILKTYFVNFNWLERALLAVSLLFLLLQAIPIYWGGDEAGYYIQTVKWIEAYPVVIGLGNLFVALTYNSSWHLLCALYHTHPFFNDLNGYLYLLVLLLGMEGFNALRKGDTSFAAMMKVGLLVFGYFQFRGAGVTMGPDFPLLIVVWLILLLLSEQDKSPLAWLLACFAFTLKLSALPLLPLVVVFRRKWRLLALFIVPYLTRNVLSSGYLFSPLSFVDIFDVDWKMAPETSRSGMITLDYLLHPFMTGKAHPYTLESVTGILPYLCTLAMLLNAWFFYKGQIRPIVALLLLSGFLFWVVLLPSWMFKGIGSAGGFLVFSLLLSVYLLFKDQWRLPFVRWGVLIGCMVMLLRNPLNVEDKVSTVSNYWLVPAPFPQAEIQIVVRQGVAYQVAIGPPLCWNTPLPCLYHLNERLELRGKDIRDGFRIKQ